MTRVVRSPDGRSWTVQSTIHWAPAQEEQFENDMAAGYVSGIAMLGVIVVLTLFVVFWTPPGVWSAVPSWLLLLLLLVLMILPIQWAVRRPWTIEAKTAEPIETSGEHWRGLVHGAVTARQDTQRVTQYLKTRATPDDGTGLLRQVT
ncbi:MAG TPA: DUF983 domain-containing protein [Pseudonocardiaceae bacterium]|jgi:hypothetical protein|nr:DUF983 domain-containing protein [Pseudonocardiaceae bacterium]